MPAKAPRTVNTIVRIHYVDEKMRGTLREREEKADGLRFRRQMAEGQGNLNLRAPGKAERTPYPGRATQRCRPDRSNRPDEGNLSFRRGADPADHPRSVKCKRARPRATSIRYSFPKANTLLLAVIVTVLE